MLKKILFILPDLKTGGTNSSFVSLYNAIKNRKLIIDVFALDTTCTIDIPFKSDMLSGDWMLHSYKANFSSLSFSQKCIALPIKILRFFEKKGILSLSDFLYERRVKKLEQNNYDAVIAFQENEPTYFTSFFTKSKKIAWIHGNYQSRYDALQPYNELELYSKFDAIVNVSDYTSNVFKSLFPSLSQKCYALYNIVDERVIKYKACEFFPSEYTNNTFRIISVGRISQVKQFDLIPGIARRLIDAGCVFEWFIIGPCEHYKSIDSLNHNIIKYSVENVVNVIGGRRNPYPYFKNANLLVCVSKSEACPMIFNEAKICGIPVVTTNFGSAFEFIKNDKDGYICSIDEINAKIECIINSTDIYETLSSGISVWENPNKEIISRFMSLI